MTGIVGYKNGVGRQLMHQDLEMLIKQVLIQESLAK